MENTRGSEWRKWDLHNHSIYSDGQLSCQELLDKAVENEIACLALTDHHTFRGVDELKELAAKNGNKVKIISGVEIRTTYGNKSVHIIGLFPDFYNNIHLTKDYLTENVLCKLGLSPSLIIEKGKQKLNDGTHDEIEYFRAGMFEVQTEFKQAAKMIHKYGGLVIVHAGNKENGIETEMKHNGCGAQNVPMDVSLGPLKEELFKEGYIDICEMVNQNYNYSFYWTQFHVPTILASDTHKAKDFSRAYCWIKADPGILGLKQILQEPERVSLNEPEILARTKANPAKYIESLKIRKKEGMEDFDEVWFDNMQIPFNPGLVAIIGNKGNGKSALTDIVSLCANSHNDKWSFLNINKFRKSKPNRSAFFEAKLIWHDQNETEWTSLDAEVDKDKVECVKYIPQSFLETLCTTEDDGAFEKEIKEIIFQYLSSEQKLGKKNLQELLDYKTDSLREEEDDYIYKISKINDHIVQLENQATSSYRTQIESQLAAKQLDLTNLEKAKPIEVPKPNPKDKKQEHLLNLLTEKSSEEARLLEQINKDKEELSEIAIKLHELAELKSKLEQLSKNIQETIDSLETKSRKYNIAAKDIVKLSINLRPIEDVINQLIVRQTALKNDTDVQQENSTQRKLSELVKELNKLRETLSGPEQAYQNYMAKLKEWEDQCQKIKGAKDINETLAYYQKILTYLDTQLSKDLVKDKEERQQLVEALLTKKKQELDTYKELFKPVLTFIEKYKEELKLYPIEFDAEFVFKDIETHFFDFVGQQCSGSFCGKEEGQKRLLTAMNDVDFNEDSSIISFPSKINYLLQYDARNKDEDRDIETQLRKGHSRKELYDYLYSLEYIKPIFQLKMSGKRLTALSPGERGALLLLFYLFIDMDEKPLIIDQPEENLDNESVYKYLVSFIKAAKKRRQIIIVTHNPNLAVVCDADQIIRMKIDKEHKNIVSFEAGAIENPDINKTIVDVLEGTYPAFHNRDKKYLSPQVE